MGTRNKVIAITVLVIILMATVFAGLVFLEYHKAYKETISRHEKSIEFITHSEFERLTRSYGSRIRGFIKANKGLVDKFEKRERIGLIQEAKLRFEVLKSENSSFDDILFILPDGTLFASTKYTHKYGNDLNSYPVIKTLKNKPYINGYSIINSQLYYISASKVVSNGRLIGYLVFKIDTLNINNYIRKMLNSDYALVVNQRTHHTEDRLNGIKELTIISGNSEILTKVPDNFDRDTHTQKINIDGSSFMLHNHKIINFNGEHIGHYLTIIDLSSLRNKQNSFIVYLCVITGIVILISVAVLYSGFDRILTRIENMSFELEKNVNRRTKELNDENKILKIENLELKEKYNEFLYMFENHKYIMALIDSATGNIIYANKAALDFLNTDDTENTLNIKSVIPVNEDYLIEKLKIASVEGFSNFETKFTDSEGNMYDFCIEGSPVEFKDKKLVFAVCRDITKDKKERENRIEIAEVLNHELATEKARRKELESILSHQAKMSALGEMLESIIHQWRQPLTAISLLMQDIEDTIQTEGKIGHDYLMGLSKEAMDQLTYMNTTIDDFRNFAKPSEDLSFFNPAEAITNISKMLIKQLIQSGIELNLKFKNIHNEVLQISNADHNSLYVPRDYSSTCKIEGYENEFKQTFLNILNNAKEALQAAQKKNGYFKGIIDINAYCDNNDIVIEISDNAGGIPQEILQDIFEPYFTTKENSGTGIGLYISKTIVEKHMKGKLTAENNDKGALFKIRLPLKLD